MIFKIKPTSKIKRIIIILILVVSLFVLWVISPFLVIEYEKVYRKILNIEEAPTLTEMPELAREYINILPGTKSRSDSKIINGKLIPPEKIIAYWITVFQDDVKSLNSVLLYPRTFGSLSNGSERAFLEFTYKLNIWDKEKFERQERKISR